MTEPRHEGDEGDEGNAGETALKEYKLIRLLGGAVIAGGLVAIMADSPIAAAVSITTGIATYVTGLLGAWWNTGG
ncbi:MAG TPA: hypothetical protein VJ698_10710 [Noviherbaspirillum sp.]|uniref:hypothetical protein n=1 Tax=Noviherbaspirillum sp. TaxID=1926288 RepID=UPI002B46F62E|nr:hypothetical protein [Noviherbaspirillum sp.]HJV85937.1 hypothetical protein [Noviherbaspirillum sp.]